MPPAVWRRFGPENSQLSKDDAAIILQSAWRGCSSRGEVHKVRLRSKPIGFYTHSLSLSYISPNTDLREHFSTKRTLYLLVEDATSSSAAQLVSITVVATIALSIFGFVLETVPGIYRKSPDGFFAAEVFCSVVFTLEYVTRFAVCEEAGMTKGAFALAPFNVLDLLAVVPFYIELILSACGFQDAMALRFLRVLRILRVIRVFKLGRYSAGMRLTAKALTDSSQAISVLLFLLAMGVVLFASMLFYVERLSCPIIEELTDAQKTVYAEECADSYHRGVSPAYGLCCTEHSAPNDFPSIIAACWWAIVTMTSVGYGEVYPKTTQGKCVAVLVMLAGMLVIALPVAIVGQKFQDAYAAHHMEGAKDAAAARMYVQGTQWAMMPGSDVCTRLRQLQVREAGLATAVGRLANSLPEVWEQREQAGRERKYQFNLNAQMNSNMTRLISGIEESYNTMDARGANQSGGKTY